MDKINAENFFRYISVISDETALSTTQILYLISLEYNLIHSNVDIYPEELVSLIQKEYIFQGRITKLGSSILKYKEPEVNTTKIAIDSTLPRITEPTANIVKRLSTHFLGDMFKGNDYKSYNEHCDNPIMAPFFFMFMNMFPTSNSERNKHWNKHFDTVWTNVNLRRVTTMTTKKFKQVWKTKDIGLFLLGTYLFIQGSHNQEKNVYFVKSLENYWKEYDYWYETAQEMLLRGELKNFTQPQKPQHQSNQFVI